MLDLTDPRTIQDVDTLASDRVESDTVETFELAPRPTTNWLSEAPIATIFAALSGGFFTALGVAGFLPFISTNGVLLGFFQVDPFSNVLHLLTGLAGLAAAGYAFRTRRGTAAIAFAVAALLVYITYFSVGNIGFGNGEGAFNNQHVLFLNLVAQRDVPAFFANTLHISFAMASLFVAAAAALQQGANATAQRGAQRIREYRSRTLIRQTV